MNFFARWDKRLVKVCHKTSDLLMLQSWTKPLTTHCQLRRISNLPSENLYIFTPNTPLPSKSMLNCTGHMFRRNPTLIAGGKGEECIISFNCISWPKNSECSQCFGQDCPKMAEMLALKCHNCVLPSWRKYTCVKSSWFDRHQAIRKPSPTTMIDVNRKLYPLCHVLCQHRHPCWQASGPGNRVVLTMAPLL